ncbi:MAG: hypothetical protein VSS75_021095 [Candidatus Parabeggiatoa sp.]|nr:hypothetical protein [Candidatus Parabeggiatoa sp.]
MLSKDYKFVRRKPIAVSFSLNRTLSLKRENKFVKLKKVNSWKNEVGFLLIAGSLGTSMSMAAEIETFDLDTWISPSAQKGGPVTEYTDKPLSTGDIYLLEVQGTHTAWYSLGQTPCGKPESNAQYPSLSAPGERTDTMVVFDAAHNFAAPKGHGLCKQIGSPRASLKYSLDDGKTWKPLAAPVNKVPDADHHYIYQLQGQGYPLQVRFKDSQYRDNYGQYRITLNKSDAVCQ